MCLVDPRIFLVAFATVFLWGIVEKKFSIVLIALGVLVSFFNLYWLIPLFVSVGIGLPPAVSGLGHLTLLNPLFLFSPHWPNNIFGQVSKPSLYFLLIPILVFSGLSPNRKNMKFAILFLLFSVLSVIPIGWIFRDPTKFFMPVVLLAGILIGQTVEQFKFKFKFKVLPVAIYIYLMFLISPALFGKLNFLLSDHEVDPSYQKIYENIKEDEKEFRTVWFTKKHPLSYETRNKAAIDGAELANFRPFAAINASEDVFNFLNNPKFASWLRVLNIKYVFLSGDARNIYPTETDIKNWETIKTLVSDGGLTKLAWGTNFDAYEVQNVLPRSFSVEKLIAVAGGDLTDTIPAIYLEDGKWDPRILFSKRPESVNLFFNNKSESDLVVSFLQKYFISANAATENQWAFYPTENYLKYKYELLIRGFAFKDFDYGEGIAFSTQKREKLVFKFEVPEDGKYFLAVRGADLVNPNLSWQIQELDLKKSTFEHRLENESDLSIFNTIALIPAKDFEEAEKLAGEMIEKFGVAPQKGLEDLVLVEEGNWTITTSNYNPAWESVPVFSMVNGYYNEK